MTILKHFPTTSFLALINKGHILTNAMCNSTVQ